MKNNHLCVTAVVILLVLLIVVGYWNRSRYVRTDIGEKTVVTSFYPIYFFTAQIAGENLNVINLTPTGTEPHEYELTTKNIRDIGNSSALILNGGGIEPWAAKLFESLENKEVLIVDTGQNLFTLRNDPHVWLSPNLAIRQSEKIRNTLVAIDPDNAVEYEKNYETLKNKFVKQDAEIRNQLANCRLNTIITSHDAFGYLALEFGLSQLAISGLSPEDEPSPRKLAQVADFAKKQNVEYIFFETLVSPRIAETIARETGAKTLVFNPIEGLTDDEIMAGEDYFSIQKKNIINLRKALSCQ